MATNGKPQKKPAARKKALMLGLGLDADDGHLRVTKGANFRLVGGSADTHATMQEQAVKLNEHLKRRGKTLDNVGREEFRELADRVGLPLLEKPAHRPN